jgi:hypothetical protein
LTVRGGKCFWEYFQLSRLALKIVVMIREQGTGNREQGIGNRE